MSQNFKSFAVELLKILYHIIRKSRFEKKPFKNRCSTFSGKNDASRQENVTWTASGGADWNL